MGDAAQNHRLLGGQARSVIWRHVLAATLACGLFAAGLTGANGYVRFLEARRIGTVAPQMFALKNQGSRLQAEAFRHPDLLVVYGSSELEQPNPYHASTLFQGQPTGFTVFPIGRGSMTSLIMLQDLAALGTEVRGKKVVISVSPPWFFLHDRTPEFYASNHSPLHLSALVFSTELSFETKRKAVRQLLQSPSLFSNDALVAFAAQRLVDESTLGHLGYLAVLPLGRLHNMFMELQDAWATYAYLTSTTVDDQSDQASATIDWYELVRRAEREQIDAASNNDLGFDNAIWSTKYAKLVAERRGKFNDTFFLDNLRHTAEWTDLDILLSGLSELGAEALIVSQPIPGKYYDTIGISASARSEYYARLRELASRYETPVIDFEDHDSDIYFVTDPNSHLSRKGWVYYDRVLDAFYHGNLPELAHSDWGASALLPGDSAGVTAALR
jgi:D-alanine transfer protein